MTDEHLVVQPEKLDLVDLSKNFGAVRALDNLTLHVRQGEFLTLLGPSGSGKTTTLRLIAGFERPTAGSIQLGGRDVTTMPPHKRDIGMVFQHYALFPHLTASENVGFPLLMRGVAKRERRRMVTEALSLVRLEGLGNRYPRQLSGGQQQRVAFARAIVFRPRLLLMDEPLGALDKKLREALQLEIKHLHRELGITILHVTHDQEEALVLSDRIALFREGRIEQLGTAPELYDQPKSIFVADFLGESNVFRGQLRLDAGRWVVLVQGLELRCREGSPARQSSGDSVALIVRPERVELRRLEEEPDVSRQQLRGRVRQVVYLGSAVKYEVDVQGVSVMARRALTDQQTPFVAGNAVVVEWPVDAAMVVQDDVTSASPITNGGTKQ